MSLYMSSILHVKRVCFSRNLERDLLLVATEFIQKDKNLHVRKSSKNIHSKVSLFLLLLYLTFTALYTIEYQITSN